VNNLAIAASRRTERWASRRNENYLKAKAAFNNKRIDECILFYATNHEVKPILSEPGAVATGLAFAKL
jgi:hypothetical protein